MTKLKFDYSGLQNTVIPSLENTISSLSRTISSASSLNIPGGFSYASELRSLPSFLSNQRSKLDHVSDWIEKSNNKFRSTQSELRALLNSINNVEIKQRIRKVK